MKKSLATCRRGNVLRFTTILALLFVVAFVSRTARLQSAPTGSDSTTLVAGRISDRVKPSAAEELAAKAERIKAAQETSDYSLMTPNAVTVASNYVFSTATNASLTSMSSGTTQLIAADQDDVASAVTLIGFDFYFQGVRQDRFSVNSNGTVRFGATPISTTLYDPLGQAGQSLISAYGADQRTHAGDGKVHFKVTGAAPNRVLVVEWLNMQSNFNTGGTSDLTYQLRLSETTGAIEFVYGSMTMTAAGAADPNSQSPQMGFSSNNVVGTVGSITAAQGGAPAPTFSGASATPVNNLYVAGTIPVLTSVADGSRRIFTLTPPVVTAPGGPLTFTGVGTTGMTLNWTDSPDELGYAIYISTDGTNFSFFNTAAQNATSFVATGLLASVTYTWKVYALSEGGTAFISGAQATNAPTPNSSLGTGLWSSPATWSTGSIPTTDDAVTIAAGTTVTIDTAASAYTVNVPGTGVLQFEQTTARTLTVVTDVSVQSGGSLQSNAAGTQTGHILSIGGNLSNNGTLDFSTNADTAGAIITFTGATNTTFSGTGATTDIRQITMNKGTTFGPIVELTVSNFTVRGVTTDTVVGGWLVMTNGTIKISGTFSGTSRVFAAAAYTIPATAGFWLNNPNYTVAGQNGSPTQSGLLRVLQGTFNIGTATGNSMGFSSGSTTIVEGGAVNATGRFGVAAAGNAITYTQTGGTITVCTIGNASATLGSFDLGTSLASSITISAGTIVTQINATAIDYRNQAGGGIVGVTGGTLQLGNAASGAAKTFNLRGVLPNLLISNTSAGHTGTMTSSPVNFNNFSLNITISLGATFNINDTTFLMGGTTLTNNGTLTANGANSNLAWFDAGGGPPQTYTGTGVATVPITNLSLQNSGGLTLSSTNQIIVNRINMFFGGLSNSNKLTLGNGGVTTAVIQFGVANPTQAVNGFDVPPVFNPGTGGVNQLYAQELTGRTTGNETPPSRTLNLLSISNPNNITIAGGDLTVNGPSAGAITLNGGRLITGANTLYLNSAAGAVSRTSGYVDGNFKKSYAAAASKTFEVGTANGFSPVTVNATGGTFPSDFTVKATQGPQPSVNPATSIQRYWTLTEGGDITADLTFNYLDPTDIMGNEANYKVIRVIGGVSVAFPGSVVNPAANTATLTGVNNFSDWTVGEITSPTAAPASISGTIMTDSGAPLAGVSVSLGGGRGNRTITNASGHYHFDNVETEGFYVVTPAMANYNFSPANRSFTLVATKTDAVFTAHATATTENPLNGADFFVRQQYLDFLNREPDMAGWLYWTRRISDCGEDQFCINQRRLDVSAAFFMSDEFQKSGNFIYGLYRAGLGRQLTYAEFTSDHQKVIGGADLETQRTEFAEEFVTRAAFIEKYHNAAWGEGFVDALLQTVALETQVDLASQREALIATYNSGSDLNHSRAAVLRAVADGDAFRSAVYNPSFVLIEYYGYLHRDMDQDGFNFWVNVLNNRTPGNYRGMVCSFMTSTEYQLRFSPVITHTNAECR